MFCIDTKLFSVQNVFTSVTSADPSDEISSRQVHGSVFSFVTPKVPSSPKLLAWSDELAEELGLSSFVEKEQRAQALSGFVLPEGSKPYALCYGGHQFGQWAGQLGDGRAITLGERVSTDGTLRMLQLKGAGPTPYSRRADGFAVLRSSVREFLCSEAMHHLRVPTTRALSLVSTGDDVLRDMFYDGNPELEPGAIVCRTAPSFLRFGNFEIFAARDDRASLENLLQVVLSQYFPHLGDPCVEVYEAWFDELVEATATLVVEWMRVGFVHGVMNTDNMSIHGVTLDYGPYGWLEEYDVGWTPNTTDRRGRYSFGNQPAVAQWNLLQLAQALVLLVGRTENLEESVRSFERRFRSLYVEMMQKKLGFFDTDKTIFPESILVDLDTVLAKNRVDMTIFFRSLPNIFSAEKNDLLSAVSDSFYMQEEVSYDARLLLEKWLAVYKNAFLYSSVPLEQRIVQMNQVNPLYVLRNYLAHEASEKLRQGDPKFFTDLFAVLKNPYQEQRDGGEFSKKRPRWADTTPGCSQLSCSS